MEITILSPTKAEYHGKNGADGAYQIFVKESRKCELRADVGGKAPAVANVLFLTPNPPNMSLKCRAAR